jgi:hypothetical protein
MSNEPEAQLSRFRAGVRQARHYGRAPLWLIEQAGSIVSYLERTNQPAHLVAEARDLVAQVMKMPADAAADD